MNEALIQKEQALIQHLKQYQKFVICYSGGVDSSYLLAAAVEAVSTINVAAVLGKSPSLSAFQYEQAQRTAQALGIQMQVIATEELNQPAYVQNAPDRCFHCKSELFDKVVQWAQRYKWHWICDGTNADDLKDYRPGRWAAEKYQVQSPLAKTGMTKADIRMLSQQRGLSTWDAPASPCLSSRIPYGTPVSPKALHLIEESEAVLRGLGFKEFRVRFHDKMARIELDQTGHEHIQMPGVKEQAVDALKKIGFQYVTIDLELFQSGRLNRMLEERIG